MKLKFLAFGTPTPGYIIVAETINSIDLSIFPGGGKFTGDDDTQAAGILDVTRIEGELYVTLAQQGGSYQCQPTNGSHDWRGTGEWHDAESFSNDTCYITATSKPEGAEYHKTQYGWTVKLPEVEDGMV
jgi:hypothetical protein